MKTFINDLINGAIGCGVLYFTFFVFHQWLSHSVWGWVLLGGVAYAFLMFLSRVMPHPGIPRVPLPPIPPVPPRSKDNDG